ncbi:DUF3311 domain-containing protein [Streptomyces sp. NPDC060020]|uniref:DUF3311 domain-containing protein n=1 Tax=Streptomyces sp. NPDC060020 TaxID=3347038 RepID=UPI00369C8C7D
MATDPGTPPTKPPAVTPVRVIIGLCLFAPFGAMFWVGSYAKVEPMLGGVPFFYWYQMAWVLISSALTLTAYKLWKRDRTSRRTGALNGPHRDEAGPRPGH